MNLDISNNIQQAKTIKIVLAPQEVNMLESTMDKEVRQLMCKHFLINHALTWFNSYREQYFESYSDVFPDEDPAEFSDFQTQQMNKFNDMLKDLDPTITAGVFEHMIDSALEYLTEESGKLYNVIACRNSMGK